MRLCVQCERDEDGRWLAKVQGAFAYGATIEEAMAKAEALALQAAAEQVERGEAQAIDYEPHGPEVRLSLEAMEI